MAALVTAFVALRIIRGWNQTGQKFAGEPDAVKVANEWVIKSASIGEEADEALEDEEEGEDLCNCQFSLAYGAKILLNTATLRLKRGHRYGLCGRNGTGKSTLMRAITNGYVALIVSVAKYDAD